MKNLTFQPIEHQSIEFTDPFAKEVCQGMNQLYEKVGFEKPWIGYLALDESKNIVGTCAFKSPPQNGIVEIAYATSPNYEGKGVATAMARYLVSLALTTDPKVKVIAQTLSQENASNHLLRNIGFQFSGEIQHPEDGLVWEWHYIKK